MCKIELILLIKRQYLKTKQLLAVVSNKSILTDIFAKMLPTTHAAEDANKLLNTDSKVSLTSIDSNFSHISKSDGPSVDTISIYSEVTFIYLFICYHLQQKILEII